MSDSEDDYMSASFTTVTEDVRPGLVKSNTLKRQYEIEEKAKESNKFRRVKPLRVIEEEKRNAGLDTALSSDNKGFSMLQKMGYVPGMKLGVQKEGFSNRGIAEPIKVQVKNNRGGLGREAQIRQRIEEKEKRKKEVKVWREEETKKLTEDFRKRMRDKVVQKHLMSDLNKMRKVCQRLDGDEGVEAPLRPWFWYSEAPEDEEQDTSEDEDEELDPEDQLYFINDYLRSKYFYCIYCGTKYDDEEDIKANCPGADKEDHE